MWAGMVGQYINVGIKHLAARRAVMSCYVIRPACEAGHPGKPASLISQNIGFIANILGPVSPDW